ncbi:MAG: hypothetical protein H6635_02895 [Anaerolineales bacterium]|nr:hypothetical protein [Anaerolineales bacterium]MCB9144289.1 hypothetical protein [Anaerolineales bacterium]
MLILITCLLLFLTAAGLLVLRVVQPNARYTWLVASGGAALAFISMFFWLPQNPSALTLPSWRPLSLFPTPILFAINGVSWALALSISALTLAILLTAVTRSVVSNSLSWAGILALSGVGILAVTANNPLTLLLIWAFIDITELVIQLSSVDGEKNNEQVVVSFSTRVLGMLFILWAFIQNFSGSGVFSFETMPSGAGIYLVMAAGLRLGILPLHLPYGAGSSLRRRFGTGLRLIGAISTLGMLGHATITPSEFTPFLLFFVSAAGLYGGWMWLRAPDELTARPYWLIGMAALAVTSALNENPVGAAAWGSAMLLTGGALFLSSVRNIRLSRAMLIGVWSLSAFPFSLTGSAWAGGFHFTTPFMLIVQALLMAGMTRHTLRNNGNETLEDQPGWAKVAYPAGITTLLVVQIILGFVGWEGALQTQSWLQAIIAAILTAGLVWGSRRLRIFNPVRAHWVSAASGSVNNIYQWLWSMYRGLARLSLTVTNAFEGEGGMMWSLLFLILFISFVMQGN